MSIQDDKLDRISASILMPIYNASKYLKQALDSVIKQTLKNIEIICINDGSTDNSLDIIRHYAKHDKRIVIIDKDNSGYGDSMNKGLSVAHGEYIAILEPDDWYEPDMLETLYSLAIKNSLDVVKGDFYQYSSQTGDDKPYNLFSKDQCNKVLDNNKDIFIYSLQPSIWSAIYRRDFLNKNNIQFLNTPGASYQDTSFNFKVFTLAKRVMFINTPLIHYRIDNNQSSINNIAKKLPNIDKEYDEIDKFIIGHKLSDRLGEVVVVCRYRTYLWAMEQLPVRALPNYIRKCSRSIKSALSSHNLSMDNGDLLRGCSLLINHRHLYTIAKISYLTAHRIKQKL